MAAVLLIIELYDLKVIYHNINYIEAIDDINIILMQLRRYEKNILLFEEDEEEYIQRFNNYMDKLKKAINRVALEVTPQLSQSHFQHILTYIDQYNQKTHEIIIMIGLKHKLIQDIRPVGRNIAESSSNKVEVLELRRFEKNYIIYEENNAVQEVHKIAKTLCSKEPELIAMFDIYLNLFDSLVTNNFQINETLQVMRTDARKIETLLQQLSENERIEMHNKIINMRNFFITALVTIVFISTIGGYFLSDRIVTTLKNMELAFKRLVNDDILIKVYENKGPIEVRHLVASYNQAATELKKIRAELNNKVQKLRKTNQVLVERQEELVEARKMTAMRLISSEIAHELNNPISSLTLLLQVFYEQLDVENPQKKLVGGVSKCTSCPCGFCSKRTPQIEGSLPCRVHCRYK